MFEFYINRIINYFTGFFQWICSFWYLSTLLCTYGRSWFFVTADLIAVLICISLISCEVEHLFICLLAIWLSTFVNWLVYHLLISISIYVCLLLIFSNFYIYPIIILWQLHTLWTFSSPLCLFFLFLFFGMIRDFLSFSHYAS